MIETHTRRREREAAEAKAREASRRYVREAAERARWAADYENQRSSPGSASERRQAPSTEAECRFMSAAEVRSCWGGAIRRAARAAFPKTTVELRRAAYLGGLLTVAGRISEERAQEHLHRAAKAAGVGPQEAERVIGDGYRSGRACAFGELSRDGAVTGHPPGAFSAVASATNRYDHAISMFVEPGALTPLPVGVLVYLNHEFGPAPVAVAVPRMNGGLVEIDAVFSSAAGAAWTLTRTGTFGAVSIYAYCRQFFRGLNGRLVEGVLTSVDLCQAGMDERAKVSAVVAASEMTPAQREVQKRFDRYLASGGPSHTDFQVRAELEGAAGLEALRPVVTPLLGKWSEPAPLRSAPARSAPTLALVRSSGPRCGTTLDGWACSEPRGHAGMHFSDRPPPAQRESTCMVWDDRARPRTTAQQDEFKRWTKAELVRRSSASVA